MDVHEFNLRSACTAAVPLSSQAVYELYNISETTTWGDAEARQSTLVIIGRNLKLEALQQMFLACCAAEEMEASQSQ